MARLVPFMRAVTLLKKYGIPVAKSRVTWTSEECLRFSRETGYPVVLKLMSSQLIHKTDIGGVLMGLKSEEEVREGYERLQALAQTLKIKAEGVLIQEMASGFEMIVGGKVDEQFGVVILVGFGGIYTEVYGDTSIRIAPIDEEEASRMVRELKAYKILRGFRGKRANIEELVGVIAKASRLMASEEIEEMDINPLFVNEKGAMAVDVRIIA
ncbi:MAG: acetate--CoA ligase family protein [Candidatus Geothermarchaeales archaeon]